MSQPQRGSARAEVSDLRNIVDRLDMLMGASTAGAAGGSVDGSQLEGTMMELTDRLSALEDEVEELRTLVNHLMTIATWQAKVTATLVGDEVEGDGDDASYDEREERYGQPSGPGPQLDRHDDGAVQAQQTQHAPRTATLDDDIDDILGVDREQPRHGHDSAPPDFGI